MTIKVVTFDLDDTLWPLRETILAAHKSANDFLASQVPSVKEILSTNKEREVWGQLIEKDPTMRHRLSELRFNVFKNILQSLGQTEQQAEKLSSEALQIFMNGRHQLTLFDAVEEVLARLKEKYTLGVLTNGNADIKRLGIDHYFNFSFSAEELNDSKPSATHFKKAMEHTSEKAASICHIGDHTECDVEGALNAGCKQFGITNLITSGRILMVVPFRKLKVGTIWKKPYQSASPRNQAYIGQLLLTLHRCNLRTVPLLALRSNRT